MSWTKQQIIEQALIEIGKNPKIFNIAPEDREDALRTLDSMMASWNGRGIRLGYALPSSPDSSTLDTDSGLPDWAIEATYLTLAIRLAPSYGKNLSPQTLMSARTAFASLPNRGAFPPEQQFRAGLPAGAGNKPERTPNYTFLPPPVDALTAGQEDNQIDFE
jgi:hypothetical protein